jgi:hypothetical protein
MSGDFQNHKKLKSALAMCGWHVTLLVDCVAEQLLSLTSHHRGLQNCKSTHSFFSTRVSVYL